MSSLVSSILGGGAQQQEEQLLQQQQNDQNAVQAGQEKLLRGGGVGLLAYTGKSAPAAQGWGGIGSGMGALRGLNRTFGGVS